MYQLSNSTLRVDVLDPAADRDKLGARYCAGGYIWQVHDAERGALLSGPTFPDAFNTFDGQGIPDAFNLSPLRPVGKDDGGEHDIALIIGAGMCQLRPNWRENEVIALCDWGVTRAERSIRMFTEQAFAAWSLTLQRDVTLLGRTVRSAVGLRNIGSADIPVRWFPHPFFPQPKGDELVKFNAPLSIPDNPGYALGDSGFISRKRKPNLVGDFQALAHRATAPLTVAQRHPLLGLVTATTSYTPSFFPIWGNANTFSWEPFLERTVPPGQTLDWWIDYDF